MTSDWQTPALLLALGAGAVLVLGWPLRRAWIRRRRRRWRIRSARKVLETLRGFAGPHADAQRFAYLRKIDPFVFEELLLTCFEERGYRIKRNRRYTGDGGIDGQVWLEGERVLVQAKRYAGHIQSVQVREFKALVRRGRVKGLFIHTGRTGHAARVEPDSDVAIISGQRLLDLIGGGPLTVYGHPLNGIGHQRQELGDQG